MKILTKVEGESWIKQNGWKDTDDIELQRRFSFSSAYKIPQDSGRKTALARQLNEIFAQYETDAMFWISGYGIWASSENQNLFYAYRKSLGEKRSLAEAPYHLFTAGDHIEAECLLDLALYFFWDVVIIAPKMGIVVKLSHDEFLSAWSQRREQHEQVQQCFERLELVRMPTGF